MREGGNYALSIAESLKVISLIDALELSFNTGMIDCQKAVPSAFFVSKLR